MFQNIYIVSKNLFLDLEIKPTIEKEFKYYVSTINFCIIFSLK